MTDIVRLSDSIEFAQNPDPRCPCVLLLDTSSSMQGARIDALNKGVAFFQQELMGDPIARKRVEVAIITFDSEVRVVQNFATPDQLNVPILDASGLTHTGSAIQRALDIVQERKNLYRDHDIAYYRPWIFMITDGAPQGEPEGIVEQAARRVAEEEAAKRVAFFAVGVEGADMGTLSRLSTRAPLMLRGLSFHELFLWLSASMQKVSQSRMDEQVALPPPGWASI
jgi:uncharacterized protein YegL